MKKNKKKEIKLAEDNIAVSNSFGKFYYTIPFLIAICIAVGMMFIGANIWLIIATVLGFYMAVNIGANDVANNMGPAVGAKAMTLV